MRQKIASIYMILMILGLAIVSAPMGCEDSNGIHKENTHHGHMHGEDTTGSHDDDRIIEDHEGGGALGEHTEQDHSDIVAITAAEMEELGIEIALAGPGSIARTIDLPGEIMLNRDNVVHIVPRVEGIVKEVHKRLGDYVTRGEILAVIESRELADATAEYLASRERLALTGDIYEREKNLWEKKISSEQEYLDAKQALAEARIAHRSAEQKLLALGLSKKALENIPVHGELDLTRYEILSPIDGTLIHKRISLGGAVKEDTELFIVADLRSVWVDINVYQKDLAFIREGQEASITTSDEWPAVKDTIDYVGPLLGHDTRTALARLIVPNPDNELRPGTFVTVTVSVENVQVPVVVPRSVLLTLDERTIVFIPAGGTFEPRPVTTGRSSGDAVEIVSGLEPGQQYVSRGAFNLKARLVTGSLDSHAGHGH